MTIRLRTVFFVLLAALGTWFFYAERHVMTPFILAGIFAYIFNPLIDFFTQRVKLPRGLSVVILYAILITLVVATSLIISQRLLSESSDLRIYVAYLLKTARVQINSLPDWIRPTVFDLLTSLSKPYVTARTFSLAPYLPKAVSEIISFIVFIFSGFYFLKEGASMFDRVIAWVPSAYKVDVEILIRKINSTFGAYLRGQIFLIFVMSMSTFVALSILGVRFALIISIISGIAEIVPVVGPIVAAILAIIVVLVTGGLHFGITSINGALIVILIYFILRHLEDYFVIPVVMGRITKLPPFMIFFAVIAGGHLAGVLGLILAVPVTAILRILLEFSLDQINGTRFSSKQD